MKRDEIEHLIDEKIRNHEFTVAIVSGLIGGLVIGGLSYAIWLNYQLVMSVQ
jgi:hypothetical protein